jgi:hypothetical protein
MCYGNLCITRKPNENLVFQYLDENGEPQEVPLTINQISVTASLADDRSAEEYANL